MTEAGHQRSTVQLGASRTMRFLWAGLSVLGLGGSALAQEGGATAVPLPGQAVQPLRATIERDALAVRADRVLVPLRVDPERWKDLELARTRGSATEEDLKSEIERLDGEAIVPVRWDEPVFVRERGTQQLQLTADKTIVDSAKMLIATLPSGTGEAPKVRSWRLFLKTRQNPAVWHEEAHAYGTDLVVGLDAEDRAERSVPLPTPVTIHFFSQGAGVEVRPDSLTLRRGGSEGYETAAIRVVHHDAAPRIVAKSAFGQQEATLAVGPELGLLRLEASRPTIAGLGFETTTLTATRLAEDGRIWAPPTPLTVNLTGGGGYYPAELTIPANASQASAVLRSAGTGPAPLRAVSGATSSEPVALTFVFPWAVLSVGIVLGGFGGCARWWMNRKRDGAARRTRRWAIGETGLGAITGILSIALATYGIVHVGGMDQFELTEAAAGIVAFLGGYAGPAALAQLARLKPGRA